MTEAEMISELCARPLGSRQVSHNYPKRARRQLCPKCGVNGKTKAGYCRECRAEYNRAYRERS